MELGRELFRQGHYAQSARTLRRAIPPLEGPASPTSRCHGTTSVVPLTQTTTEEGNNNDLIDIRDSVTHLHRVSDSLRMEGDAWRVAGQRWRAYEAHKAALAAAEEAGDRTRFGFCCATLALSTLAMHGVPFPFPPSVASAYLVESFR